MVTILACIGHDNIYHFADRHHRGLPLTRQKEERAKIVKRKATVSPPLFLF